MLLPDVEAQEARWNAEEQFKQDSVAGTNDDILSKLLRGGTSEFLETGTDSNGKPVRIHYAVLGAEEGVGYSKDPRPKALLIMGLSANLAAWKPQMEDLLMPEEVECDGVEDAMPVKKSPMLLCVMDNRGIGHSSSPRNKKDYTTTIMAQDCLKLLEHLGWEQAHVVGFSMGGMISCKLAAMQPSRVASLCIISSSRGGWDCVPRSWKAFKYLWRAIRDQSPHGRATVDIKFHFSKQTRRTWLRESQRYRDEVLHEEYVVTQATFTPQPPYAADGHRNACWTHSLSPAEAEAIRGAGFPVLCIHGRHDLCMGLPVAEKLAKMLASPLLVLDGAHFLPRECGHDVNLMLESMILGQARQALRAHLDRSRHLEPQILMDAVETDKAAASAL